MLKIARPALTLFIVLSLVTGLLYPALTTWTAQVLFPTQAAGSLIERDGRIVGSTLIGQSFGDPKHFWSRLSATAPQPYNGDASGGSNLAPSNPALVDAVKARVDALRAVDPDNASPIPVDLVTASASGLDPHVSPAAAEYQATRVARERGLPIERVRALIEQATEAPALGVLGEPGVNVLRLNLALDAERSAAPPLRRAGSQ